MKKNIVWCKTDEETKGYKYIAVLYESNTSYGQTYASNNLRDLKSFVYNCTRQSFNTAKGDIYLSSDEYYSHPIYMVHNEYNGTTHIKNGMW